MFLCQCGSRCQLENERKMPAFLANLLALSHTGEPQTATADTMNYLMSGMDPENGLAKLPGRMTARLIDLRVLERYRNTDGEYLVAIDAVHLFSRRGRHPGGMYKTIGGKLHTCYYVLEAKVVTADGFAFSLASAFIENEEDYDKQDCELKAFYRLTKILKQRFPRLRLCLLLDGLYANRHVLARCEKNGWGFAIVFKSGSIPSLYAEMLERMASQPVTAGCDFRPGPGVFQHLDWVSNLKYDGLRFHALRCRETTLTSGRNVHHQFVWLTDARANRQNAAILAGEDRNRWKIENQGFNVQKNGGYGLEHNYGTVGFAMKNYYYLLQVAHFLHQLMVNSDLFPKLQRKISASEHAGQTTPRPPPAGSVLTALAHFHTVKNFVRRLAESFRTQFFSSWAMEPQTLGKIQIRFSSA